MEVELGASVVGGGRVTELDELDDEGNTVEPAIDNTMDVLLEGREVAEERWVRM